MEAKGLLGILKSSPWAKQLAGLIGVLTLCVLVWTIAPLIDLGGLRPLSGVATRLTLVAIILIVAGSIAGVRWYLRLRAARALERAMRAAGGGDRDQDALTAAMNDALTTLRRSKSAGRTYLYQIPWYMIIGRPSSGKTTALINSGLKFPLNAGDRPTPVAGSGSTRFCDWYFTENAVLIDTAGRYTTQDDDVTKDSAAWRFFLDLLVRHRPQQPINGVIVALSVSDLVAMTDDQLAAYAASIRKRLLELRETLDIDFPIYVVLTKADLVTGFREAFSGAEEAERRIVWGATFQADKDIRGILDQVEPEFDALVQRLNEQLPDRMQAEPDPGARIKLFGLPSQVATLKAPLINFLTQIFEPSRFHANATLRGFYLTSATQQGTPFDRLIGAMTAEVGMADGLRVSLSNLGKSYFLADLLEKVVIPEAGWVSTNRAAIQRAALLRAATFAALAVMSLAIIGLWAVSYMRNKALIAAEQTELSDYAATAGSMLREPTVADADFSRILPLLDKLRFLPAGYADRAIPVPLADRMGLSQGGRLRATAEALYGNALERLLRPRLIYRLEQQLDANRNNPAFLYNALKVYLMLGGQVKTDRALVEDWLARDWAEHLFPGPANANGRRDLAANLDAMLEIDNIPVITLNGPLVEDVQRTLARLSVAERAFEILKSSASAQSATDWVAAQAGGPDANLVFAAADGRALDSVRVPYIFTSDGFQRAFIDKLVQVGDQVEKDRWVLGSAGEQASVTAQYSDLYLQLSKLYTKGFVQAWTDALGHLRLRPLTTDKPRYLALTAAAAPTSPIKQLMVSIATQTALTHEAGAAPADAGAQKTSHAKTVVLDLTAKAATKNGAPAPVTDMVPDDIPGAAAEARFRAYQLAVQGEGGRVAIDAVLSNLGDILQTLELASSDPTQVAAANAALLPQVAALRGNASRLPPPFSDMLRKAANEFEGDVSSVAARELAAALADQVTRPCEQILADRYPFAKESDRDVVLSDFGRLFSPNGIIDGFFAKNLAPLVDQSSSSWTSRPNSRLGRALSAQTLDSFQQASTIRDTFFSMGGQVPAITLTVTPITLSGAANSSKLEVGTSSFTSEAGSATPGSVMWPAAGAEQATITLDLGFFSSPAKVSKTGPWSLFHLIDSAASLNRGNKLVTSFSVQGKDVTYQFSAATQLNPLTLPALHQFKCPSGL